MLVQVTPGRATETVTGPDLSFGPRVGSRIPSGEENRTGGHPTPGVPGRAPIPSTSR